MRFEELGIQTQRSASNEFRTPGAAFLYRAGYIARDTTLTTLGDLTAKKMARTLETNGQLSIAMSQGHLPTVVGDKIDGSYFLPQPSGQSDILFCIACRFGSNEATFPATPGLMEVEPEASLTKVLTPGCSTINSLAEFLNIPASKTAKALMFSRVTDGRFVFVVVRGDKTLSQAKLEKAVGPTRMATQEEILAVGAVPGYASPIGIHNALVVVDSAIPLCRNLAAGANEVGYHFINTNCGRDYTPELVADLVLATEGDPCPQCGSAITASSAFIVVDNNALIPENLLQYMAETHHDEKGLQLPASFAPFAVHLMNIPGSTLDTAAATANIYAQLTQEGIPTLIDNRNERAGVKFNDADLLGLPIRITVGERALQNGQVEVKARTATESRLVAMDQLPIEIAKLLENNQ